MGRETANTDLLLGRLVFRRCLSRHIAATQPSSSLSSFPPFFLLPLERNIARMGKLREGGVGVLELQKEPEENVGEHDLKLHLQVSGGGERGKVGRKKTL